MTTRKRNASRRVATQAFDLALTAPQVAAHRIARMSAAGTSPNARDRAEFGRMVNEKTFAFYEAWSAIWAAAFTAQIRFAQSMASSMLATMQGRRIAPGLVSADAATRAGTAMLAAALAPVHRKTMANAKRLARRRK